MSASRSVVVQLINNTNQNLTLGPFGLEGGIWSNNGSAIPPAQIAANSSGTWESESNGAATGTEGFANYVIGGNSAQVVSLSWDDPFVGSNSYSGTCPPGFQVPFSGGSGDNATVVFTLSQT